MILGYTSYCNRGLTNDSSCARKGSWSGTSLLIVYTKSKIFVPRRIGRSAVWSCAKSVRPNWVAARLGERLQVTLFCQTISQEVRQIWSGNCRSIEYGGWLMPIAFIPISGCAEDHSDESTLLVWQTVAQFKLFKWGQEILKSISWLEPETCGVFNNTYGRIPFYLIFEHLETAD